MPNPIDKTQRERLGGARRALQAAVEELQRCKAVGLDVADREEGCAQLYDQLQLIQATYTPGEIPAPAPEVKREPRKKQPQ